MRSGASAARRGKAAAMLQGSVMGPCASEQVAVEEIPDPRHQHLVLVFQHIVAGVVVDLLLGLRQRVLETLEEVVVEHEVLQAPADEGGAVGEGGQAAAGVFDE